MKRQPHEVYGFGRRLTTRTDRAVHLARLVLLTSVLGTLVAVWPW